MSTTEFSKGNTFRVYLPDAETTELRTLAERIHLSQGDILGLFCKAGLRAVADNRGILPLPLVFHLPENCPKHKRN